MFIEQVIRKIWEPISVEYQAVYNEYIHFSADELVSEIKAELENTKLGAEPNELMNVTSLITSGCPHCKRDGNFAGCSFCDFYSTFGKGLAKVDALKEKNKRLYAQITKYSIEVQRGQFPEAALVEYFSGHDTLNPDEVIDDIYEELFSDGQSFKTKAYSCFFETRASNITLERLINWKKKIGDKISKRIEAVFGVELSNEWLRVHWLNKNITNKQIIKAITEIRKAKLRSGATILIGIPGLTERQSLEMFIDSFGALYKGDLTHIVCSPLIHKGYTLQAFLHNSLGNNEFLLNQGIGSGMPSIYTVFDAVVSIVEKYPDAINKMIFCPAYFPPYLKLVADFYRHGSEKFYVNEIIRMLNKYSLDRATDELFDLRDKIAQTEFYKDYKKRINRQNGIHEIPETIETIGKEIAKVMWPDNWPEKHALLAEELKTYSHQSLVEEII